MEVNGKIRHHRAASVHGARARLLPASATVGVFIAITTALLVGLLQAKGIYLDGIASALYVSNYRFAFRGHRHHLGRQFRRPRPMSTLPGHWRRGTVLSDLARLDHRVRRGSCAVAPAGAPTRLPGRRESLSSSSASSQPFLRVVPDCHERLPRSHSSLPTRAWSWAGGLVALTVNQWRRLPALAAAIAGWAGLLLILLASSNGHFSVSGTAALLPVLGTLVIGRDPPRPRSAADRCSHCHRCALSAGCPAWYLTHWPVPWRSICCRYFDSSGWLAPAPIVISGVLAWLLMRVIENPFRFRAGADHPGAAWRSAEQSPPWPSAGHARSASCRGQRPVLALAVGAEPDRPGCWALQGGAVQMVFCRCRPRSRHLPVSRPCHRTRTDAC